MNLGQEKFYDFIMGSVKEDCKDKAEEVLKESFAKQDEGTFDAEYLEAFDSSMMELIKPECYEKAYQVIMNYKAY